MENITIKKAINKFGINEIKFGENRWHDILTAKKNCKDTAFKE